MRRLSSATAIFNQNLTQTLINAAGTSKKKRGYSPACSLFKVAKRKAYIKGVESDQLKNALPLPSVARFT